MTEDQARNARRACGRRCTGTYLEFGPAVSPTIIFGIILKGGFQIASGFMD